MNKADLVKEVAKVVSSKKEAQAAVDSIFAAITNALKEEDRVTVVGFGAFKVERRKARNGRNPRTGEEIKIAERNIPKFVPGRELKALE